MCPKCKSITDLHIEDIRSKDECLVITSICKRMNKKGKICGGTKVFRYKQRDRLRKKMRRRYQPKGRKKRTA